jgi:tetratricopeptide (TPR) repeat protein
VFHDLIREYALTLLPKRPAEASARLVNHYVRSTREAILTFGRPGLAPVDDTMAGIVPETFASSADAIRWRERARFYFDMAAETFQHAGNRAGQANVYRNMAHRLVMEPDERIAHLRQSAAIARELTDQPILATMLHGLASVLWRGGKFDEELAVLDECASITANQPALVYLDAYVLAARAAALAGSGRLEESADEAGRALEILRREGDVLNEISTLISHGDALTALGRTREAAEIWRRFLTLATSPELVRSAFNGNFGGVDDDINAAQIIDGVKAKLAALTVSG